MPAPETEALGPNPLTDDELTRLLRDLEDVSLDAAKVIVGQGEQIFEALSALVASEDCWKGREAGVHALFLLASLGLPTGTEVLLTGIKHGLKFGSVACLSRVGQLFRPAGSGAAARLREIYQNPEQQSFLRTACLEANAGLALDDKDVLATVVRDCDVLRADGSETDLALLSAQILAALLQDRYGPDIRELLGDDSDALELIKFPLEVESFGVAWWRRSPLDHFSPQTQAARADALPDPGWKRGEPPPMLTITAAEAEALGDGELLALLREAGDGLPDHVAAAVVSRGERLGPALVALLEDERLWAVAGREAWTVIHAALLLAAIGDDEAAAPLVQALRNADKHHVSVLLMSAEILFRELSGDACGALLRDLTHDTEASEILRMCSLPSRSALALRDDAVRTELLTDFSSFLKGDLDEVAKGWLGYFHAWGFADEIAVALSVDPSEAETKNPWLLEAEAPDEAKTHLLRSPLSFYSDDERRERWTAVDPHEAEDSFDSDGAEELPDVEPFVRETPKVGRNDPCPCGSGRKFKKCCLRKT